jgi:hypothetical protein
MTNAKAQSGILHQAPTDVSHENEQRLGVNDSIKNYNARALYMTLSPPPSATLENVKPTNKVSSTKEEPLNPKD